MLIASCHSICRITEPSTWALTVDSRSIGSLNTTNTVCLALKTASWFFEPDLQCKQIAQLDPLSGQLSLVFSIPPSLLDYTALQFEWHAHFGRNWCKIYSFLTGVTWIETSSIVFYSFSTTDFLWYFLC